MASVSVADLRESLDRYLDQVKAGGEVVVTEDGKAIARLVPVEASSSRPMSYDELVEAGVVRPPKLRLPPEFWDEELVPDPEGRVLKYLLEEREHGW